MSEPKRVRIGGAEVRVNVPDEVANAVGQAWREAVGHTSPKARRAAKNADRREPLNADRIVDVALRQMRDSGYDGVTMRSIARELGTGPASLYAHVANRQELDALVLDRVSSQLRIPDPDPERWAKQVKQVGLDLYALYAEHPGVARASMGMIPIHPGALMASQRFLAVLRAGRVPDQAAAWFLDVFMLYVGSVAVEQDIWRLRVRDGGSADESEVVHHFAEVFASLPADAYPLLRSMAGVLTSGSGDDRFHFGLDLLIGGLQALSDAD